jgi:hypothetical protein
VVFFCLLLSRERTLCAGLQRGVSQLDNGDLVNTASLYFGADGDLRPRKRAIAPVDLQPTLIEQSCVSACIVGASHRPRICTNTFACADLTLRGTRATNPLTQMELDCLLSQMQEEIQAAVTSCVRAHSNDADQGVSVDEEFHVRSEAARS